jgi:hypothetical protein
LSHCGLSLHFPGADEHHLHHSSAHCLDIEQAFDTPDGRNQTRDPNCLLPACSIQPSWSATGTPIRTAADIRNLRLSPLPHLPFFPPKSTSLHGSSLSRFLSPRSAMWYMLRAPEPLLGRWTLTRSDLFLGDIQLAVGPSRPQAPKRSTGLSCSCGTPSTEPSILQNNL